MGRKHQAQRAQRLRVRVGDGARAHGMEADRCGAAICRRQRQHGPRHGGKAAERTRRPLDHDGAFDDTAQFGLGQEQLHHARRLAQLASHRADGQRGRGSCSKRSRWRLPAFWRPCFTNRVVSQRLLAPAGPRPSPGLGGRGHRHRLATGQLVEASNAKKPQATVPLSQIVRRNSFAHDAYDDRMVASKPSKQPQLPYRGSGGDLVVFAPRFIMDRMAGFEKDMRICLTPGLATHRKGLTHAYFPGLAACCGAIEYLGALSVGNPGPIKKGLSRGHVQDFARRYMAQPHYDNEAIRVLWDLFRNGTAHHGITSGVWIDHMPAKLPPPYLGNRRANYSACSLGARERHAHTASAMGLRVHAPRDGAPGAIGAGHSRCGRAPRSRYRGGREGTGAVPHCNGSSLIRSSRRPLLDRHLDEVTLLRSQTHLDIGVAKISRVANWGQCRLLFASTTTAGRCWYPARWFHVHLADLPACRSTLQSR